MRVGLNLGMGAQRGQRGPIINLSASTVADTAAIGTVVGTLSVSGGTGTYTYTLTNSAGAKYSISSISLLVAAALTAGSDAITIQANNGAGSILSRAFLITVTHSGAIAGLAMDMSDFRNTYILGL